MNNLEGKIALITGATSGIGEASAKRFAKAGAMVIITGRDVERGNRVTDSIEKIGGKAAFYEMDLANDESIKSTISKVESRYGMLDILFNNAGIYPISPSLELLTRDLGTKIFDINVSGLLMTIQACFPLLLKSNGVILNNASAAGLQSYSAGQSYMYSGSKAAVIKITQLIAKKYGGQLRANVICPGIVRTPLYKSFDENRYKASIPAGRVGEPEDVAAVANFLVSDDAKFVNGAVITIDGGQSL